MKQSQFGSHGTWLDLLQWSCQMFTTAITEAIIHVTTGSSNCSNSSISISAYPSQTLNSICELVQYK